MFVTTVGVRAEDSVFPPSNKLSHFIPPKSQFLTVVRNRASVVQRRSL